VYGCALRAGRRTIRLTSCFPTKKRPDTTMTDIPYYQQQIHMKHKVENIASKELRFVKTFSREKV